LEDLTDVYSGTLTMHFFSTVISPSVSSVWNTGSIPGLTQHQLQ